jgi:hypothetical protein
LGPYQYPHILRKVRAILWLRRVAASISAFSRSLNHTTHKCTHFVLDAAIRTHMHFLDIAFILYRNSSGRCGIQSHEGNSAVFDPPWLGRVCFS